MRSALFFLTFSLLAVPLDAQDQPSRPPITGIAHVRLFSTDAHKSLDFFGRILGLTPRDAGCAGLARPCFMISNRQQIQLSQVASPPSASLLAELAFATPDAVRMHNYLLAHKVSVGPVTRDITGVAHFLLYDPEGHAIAFVQPHPRTIFTTPAGQISTSMVHAGFIVKNRGLEDHFFVDLLGFREYWHGGMKDDQTDRVDMQVPDGTDWLEYQLNVSPNADKRELGIMDHIALGVPDIKAAKERLLKNGWTPGEEPQIGRDGKWHLNLYDPDGTRVELMEFTPVQKPCCSEYTGPHPTP